MNVRDTRVNRLFFTMAMMFALTCGYAGQTNSTNAVATSLVATNNSPLASDPTEITTLDGTTYKSVRVLKVDPDGLMIEYAPPTGGIGLGKLKFANLSAELQSRYGYDAQKAAEYQTAQAAGEARFRKEMQTQQEQAWAAERARAEDNFKARQEIDRQTEAARLQAEKEMARIRAEAERNRYINIGSRGSGPRADPGTGVGRR